MSECWFDVGNSTVNYVRASIPKSERFRYSSSRGMDKKRAKIRNVTVELYDCVCVGAIQNLTKC